MLITNFTRRILKWKRDNKVADKIIVKWIKDGYEQVNESGGKLWEIYRGYRYSQIIKDVKIAPDGKSLYVKIGHSEDEKARND